MWISVCCNCILSMRCFVKWLRHYFKRTAFRCQSVLYFWRLGVVTSKIFLIVWTFMYMHNAQKTHFCLNCCWWHHGSQCFPLFTICVSVCAHMHTHNNIEVEFWAKVLPISSWVTEFLVTTWLSLYANFSAHFPSNQWFVSDLIYIASSSMPRLFCKL